MTSDYEKGLHEGFTVGSTIACSGDTRDLTVIELYNMLGFHDRKALSDILARNRIRLIVRD